MPDIGYYTLPVIPSFKGIESATQDALDKAFRDSATKAGQAYADEHEKAFRKTSVEATKQRRNDSTVTNAEKEQAADAGKRAGEAYGEAFHKSKGWWGTSGDSGEKEAAQKSGADAGKAAGEAYVEEVKKTAGGGGLLSAGSAIGKALGQGAGKAAGEAIADMLPDALKGAGLDKLGEQAGGQLGEAIGGHLDELPGKIRDGFTKATGVISGASEGIKGALNGIKTVAEHAHDSTFHIGDGVKVAADALRGLNINDLTTGLDRVASMVQQAEPLASAFGVDISSWPGDIQNVVGPAQTLSDTFDAAKGAVSGTADALAVIAQDYPAIVTALEAISAAAGPIAIALGGVAAGVYGLSKLRDFLATGGGDRPAGVTPDQARALWNGASPGDVANPNIPTAPAQLGDVGTPLPAGTPEPPHTGVPTLVPGTGSTPPLRGGPDGSSTSSTPGGGDLSDLLGGHQYGGGIYGPGPKGKDSVLMYGAPGEHMWTADEVDKVGGHGAMYALRALAKAGALSGLTGYEGGGAIQGGGAAGGAGGGNLNNLYRYVDSMVGTPYSTQNRTDCSGMAARIASVALGLPPAPSFTTSNEGSWLTAHGFVMGNGPTGTLRIGWYDHGGGQNGHTAVTLPDGTHAEAGGSHGSFLVGGGAAGAENSEFENRAWLPMNPQGPASGGVGGAAAGPGGGAGAFGSTAGGGAGGAGAFGGGGGMAGVAGSGGGGAAGGSGQSPFEAAGGAGALGDIGKQFMSDTFGFGTILPGLDKFPPLQMLFGLLGGLSKTKTGNPQGDQALKVLGGLFGGGSGSAGAMGSLFGMLPHMSRRPTGAGGGGMVGVGAPDLGGDAQAFPGIDLGGARGGGGGGGESPAGPANIDQSTNVTVNGHSTDDVISRVTRQLQWTPRLQTYTPPGAG